MNWARLDARRRKRERSHFGFWHRVILTSSSQLVLLLLFCLFSLISRLQFGYVDLKDAIKWQIAHLITSRTHSGVVGRDPEFIPTNTNTNGVPACDFGFLLTFVGDVPDQEYNMVVSTLPRSEQLAARRVPGYYGLLMSNNPANREYKNDGQSSYKKRGKKNPKQDAMGQKTVMEALPKMKPQQWAELEIFKNIETKFKTEAANTSANANTSSSAPTPNSTASVILSTSNSAPADTSSAMDTSSSEAAAAPPTSTSISASVSSTIPSLRPGIVVSPSYSLPLTTLVPIPTLLLTAHREPILLCGYYRKFYRFLSQSVWTIGDQKMIGAGSEKAKAEAKVHAKQGAAVSSLITDQSSSASSTTTIVSSSPADSSPTPSPTGDLDDVDEREIEQQAEDDQFAYGADDDGNDDGDDDGGRRMTDSSVEEEIVRMMLQHFEAKEYKFHSSGREDMDVRMLGNGRQFMIEFIEAKKVPK